MKNELRKEIIKSETLDAQKRADGVVDSLEFIAGLQENPIHFADKIRDELIEVAYNLHVIDLELGHVSKLKNRIGKAGNNGFPLVNMSPVKEKYNTTVRELLTKMTDDIRQEGYRSVTDAISSGLISPDDLGALETELDIARENTQRAKRILDSPDVLIGDLTNDNNPLETRFLTVGLTGHAVTSIYYQKNPLYGKSNGIFTGVPRLSDILEVSDKEIDVRNLRVDKTPVIPKKRARSIRKTLDDIDASIDADRAEIYRLAKSYDSILAQRKVMVDQVRLAVSDLFGYEVNKDNLVKYEGQIEDIRQALYKNHWITGEETLKPTMDAFKSAQGRANSVRTTVDKEDHIRYVQRSFESLINDVPVEIQFSYHKTRAQAAMSGAAGLVEANPWLKQTSNYSRFLSTKRRVDRANTSSYGQRRSSIFSDW